MIAGIGIDLVKRERMERAALRWQKRFLDRLFTPSEQTYSFSHRDPYLHLAGRFAVKEAVLKALGTGWGKGVRWKEIEVLNDPDGKPHLHLSGRVKEMTERRGITDAHVSISHDTDYSIGQAILLTMSDRES